MAKHPSAHTLGRWEYCVQVLSTQWSVSTHLGGKYCTSTPLYSMYTWWLREWNAVIVLAVRGGRWHAAARQFIESSGEDGNWGDVHLLLDSRTYRGDWKKGTHGAQVIFQLDVVRHSVTNTFLLIQPCSTPEPMEREAALRQKIELLKRDRAAICLPNPSPETEAGGLRTGQQGGARARMADAKKEKASLFYELVSVRVRALPT